MSYFADRSRVLIPVIDHLDLPRLVDMAAAIGSPRPTEITVLDVVEVPPDQDLSTGATAARLSRARLEALADALPHVVQPAVRIDRSVASGVAVVARELEADLVLAGYSANPAGGRSTIDAVAGIVQDVGRNEAGHVAMVRLGPVERPSRVVVAVRGGPHAELALEMGSGMAAAWRLPIIVLHVMSPGLTREARRASERSLLTVARQFIPGDVNGIVIEAVDVVEAIRGVSTPADVLLLGASISEHPDPIAGPFGEAPDRLMREVPGAVIVTRTRERVAASTFEMLTARSGTLASVDRAAAQLQEVPRRVDRWFAESNFHHEEFARLDRLVLEKERHGLTVSLVLPTLNEAETIGAIVRCAREELVERWPVVDELLVIDSASADRTVAIAESEGARVVEHPEVLAEHGSFSGKGEALWKSLYATTGDIVAWADTDVRDWHPRFVYGTVGPLLLEPRLQYVKGYYQRPIVEGGTLKSGGGGRVTELVARPLVNLLYPELSGFIQPLAGEYAGRRSLLEAIPFFTGYAVEIGHLIDIYERIGLDGLGQVDLERRVHRNQELEGLSKMSFVILQAILKRLEAGRRVALFAELGSRMKLPRATPDDLFLEVFELGDHERPPMLEIPQYVATHPRVPATVRSAPDASDQRPQANPADAGAGPARSPVASGR